MVSHFLLLGLAAPVVGKYIHTPNGLWPEECMHNIPSGTKIREHATGVHYTFPDGSEEYHGNCTVKIPQTPELNAAQDGNEMVVYGNGHAYPLAVWGQLEGELESFTAHYNVPRAPKSDEGQTLFWWFGAQDGNPPVVIQPVLGWTGGQWTFSSWNCCPSGHQQQGSSFEVSEGDTLTAKIERSGDGFSIISEANGQQSVLQANDGIIFKDMLLSLETYNVNKNCDLLPQGCLQISDMEASPSLTGWDSNFFSGWGMDACGWTIQNTNAKITTCPPNSPSPSPSPSPWSTESREGVVV